MKKRKGYISIIALIIMSVSMIMILQIIFLNNLQNGMISSRSNNLQSYYLSEGKILMSLYDDKYYDNQLHPILLDVFRRNDFSTDLKSIIIDESDLEEDSISDVKLIFKEEENTKGMMINAQSDYRGIKTKVNASTTLINKLFEIGDPILSMNSIEEEYKKDLNDLLINIEENIISENIDKWETLYTKEICNFDKIILKKVDNKNHNLICTRKTMDYPSIYGFDKREAFIIIKKFNDNKPTFHIDCSDKSMKLSGIIYVEGDVEISGDFTFNGIIVVKDGEIKINTEIKPKIYGMIILYDDKNISKIEEKLYLQYYDFVVYKYGIFIPGFLDINVKSIKNGEYRGKND